MAGHDIVIDDSGLHFVYSDDLVGLFDGEEATTTTHRVSEVEPVPGGGWSADMGLVGGGLLLSDGHGGYLENAGGEAFRTRQEALDAEREWLRRERGL